MEIVLFAVVKIVYDMVPCGSSLLLKHHQLPQDNS